MNGCAVDMLGARQRRLVSFTVEIRVRRGFSMLTGLRISEDTRNGTNSKKGYGLPILQCICSTFTEF